MEQPFATDRGTLEREVLLSFVRGSGPGGQHRNKTETGVRLVHPPSGIVITVTERRSQLQNRELAFERLIERLAARNRKPKPRRKTRKPAGAERERLAAKKRRAAVKRDRRGGGDE